MTDWNMILLSLSCIVFHECADFYCFAMRLGSHCEIWLSHECADFCSKIKQSLQNLAIFSHVPQVLPHDINKVNFYLVCVLFEYFPVK